MDREEALAALRRDKQSQPVPRPDSRRRGSWWTLGGAVLLSLALGAGAAWWGLRETNSPPVTVRILRVPLPVATGDKAVLSVSGFVVPGEQATVSSMITGRVRKVLVVSGQRVHKGEVVALLDSSLQRASLAEALATLKIDVAGVAQARANLAQALLTRARRQTLAAREMISRAKLDQARTGVKVIQAVLKSALARVAMDRAGVRMAQLNVGYTRIRAPFSGVVTKVYAQAGEMISPAAVGGFTQTGICRLVNMKSLEITVDVNETYLDRLHRGMPARVTLSAWPGWKTRAHVVEIVPAVNRAQATVPVRLVFDRLSQRILPGMQAQVRLYPAGIRPAAGGAAASALLLPAGAVHHDAAGEFVYLVVDRRLVRRKIAGHKLADSRLRVVSGLAGGEQVVVSANGPLRAGALVHHAARSPRH